MIETRESGTAAMELGGTQPMTLPESAGELAEAVVDHAALAANVRTLRSAAGTQLMAVVKADAFGHGAAPVARTCLAAGATWLGVTRVSEALELRRSGVGAPILAWLFDPARSAEAVAAGVDLSVSSPADLAAVARVSGAPRIHLKLDTGLHRSGCPGEDWSRLVSVAASLESAGRVRVAGIWSHLSHGGRPDAVPTHRQLLMFRVGLDLARAAGLRPEVVHLANTAAVQANARDTAYDLVRVGAGVYGIGEGLRPALTLRTRVVQVRRVAAGRGVGYDHVGRTTRDTHLALVPVGYADGLPRAATGRASIWVGGRRAPLIGRVCMDQVVADLGPEPVAVGTEVVVLGPGDHGEPTARDWAAWSGTNEHEIYTGIGSRVGRRHVGADWAVDRSSNGREQS
ncbi:alanine racemase [Terrabacter terrigena]|uniref:Alanine racemase n=1 Tax=Terrabacter terrigena TaxID=574718 RepID=A0ABW3MRT2_9MICO